MSGANLTRVEAEARACVVRVHDYRITLDLTRGGEVFGSDTTVRFAATPGASSFIEANTVTLHTVTLNGEALDPATVSDGHRIRLDNLAAENELRVVSDAGYTNTGEGLHRFVDPVDDKAYVYTQFAVAEANRVFAVFDQPDMKSSYQYTITAPADWHVMSNSATPMPQAGVSTGSTLEVASWTFEPSPPMSSYITAVIAGPYAEWRSELTTIDGRVIPLGLYARASLAQHVEPEVMFDKTRQGFGYYESNYGVPFPYDKYDQIFVPEYNWGAMENVGAVTFNESYLYRATVTEARKEQRAIVVLHELSHMWFGNLVTMKWWNDLWLNESFATWTSTIAAANATEYTDSWATFTTTEKTHAYHQDQLPSTHPIVATINDLEDVEVNFDGITYSKGASVIKQLVAWVGLDAFYAGIGAYLRKHAGGNATLRDLLDELEVTSGRPLTEWSELWLETAGVNTLRSEIVVDESGTITDFAVLQSATTAQPTIRPHRLAIGFYDDVDGAVVRTHRIELDVDGERSPVAALVGLKRPALVLLNDDDLSYAKIRLDAESYAFALAHLGEIADPLARALVWGAAWDTTRDAEASPSDFVHLVLAHLAAETQSAARALALRQLEFVLGRYIATDNREALTAEAAATLWNLADYAEPGSDAQLQFVKSFISIADAAHLGTVAALYDGSLELDGIVVDTDLRWELLTALAAGGRDSEQLVSAELARDNTAKGQQSAATVRGARPTPAAKQAAWAAVANDTTLSNDMVRYTSAGWRRSSPPSLLEDSLEPYFAMIEGVWSERSYNMAAAIIRGLYPSPLASQTLAAASHNWLNSHPDAAPSLRRIIIEELAEVERALAAQERDTRA